MTWGAAVGGATGWSYGAASRSLDSASVEDLFFGMAVGNLAGGVAGLLDRRP